MCATDKVLYTYLDERRASKHQKRFNTDKPISGLQFKIADDDELKKKSCFRRILTYLKIQYFFTFHHTYHGFRRMLTLECYSLIGLICPLRLIFFIISTFYNYCLPIICKDTFSGKFVAFFTLARIVPEQHGSRLSLSFSTYKRKTII